jgi:hypothetical protein
MEVDDMEAVHFLLAFSTRDASADVKSEPAELIAEPEAVPMDVADTLPSPVVIPLINEPPGNTKRAGSQRARKPTSKVRQNNSISPSSTTIANPASSNRNAGVVSGSAKRPRSEVGDIEVDAPTNADVVLPSPSQPTQQHKKKRSRTTAASKQQQQPQPQPQQQQQQPQPQQQHTKSNTLATEVSKAQLEWRTRVADVLSDFRILLQRTMSAENAVYEHVQYTRQDIHTTLASSMKASESIFTTPLSNRCITPSTPSTMGLFLFMFFSSFSGCFWYFRPPRTPCVKVFAMTTR